MAKCWATFPANAEGGYAGTHHFESMKERAAFMRRAHERGVNIGEAQLGDIANRMTAWRRTMGARVSKLSKAQALDYLRRIRERGTTIDQPAIRELTGGYASQSINGAVQRRLAAQAGMIAKRNG